MNINRTRQLLVGIAIGLGALGASFHASAQNGASAGVTASAPGASKSSSKAADRALRRRVLNALAKAKGLRAGGITVRATGGDVLLEGWAPEQAQIDQATRVTQGVPGVKSVRNELTLSTF